MINSKNKVLVTGGSRGIGAECVRSFCLNGYSVAFLYNKSDECAKQLAKETGAIAIKADVCDPKSVKNAVCKIEKTLGGIDILVNNAGVSSFSVFDGISDDEWGRTIGTNLSGSFYVAREVCRCMIREKYGRIINIGSVWGCCGASCEVHYSASKAGVRGMTMALAKELGPSGITVNCVEPGVIETEMNAALSDEEINKLVEDIPACRIGLPSDVADLVLFLASEKSSYITGQCIGVDGGFAL